MSDNIRVPYSLESFKNKKKPICRNGSIPVIAGINEDPNVRFCIAGWHEGTAENWDKNGRYANATQEEGPLDLFEQPEEEKAMTSLLTMESKPKYIMEFEFSATDVDSSESITDTISVYTGFTEGSYNEEGVIKAIDTHLHREHPVCSLSGNRWEVNGIEPTGYVQKEVKFRTVISTRKADFYKDYPIMSE